MAGAAALVLAAGLAAGACSASYDAGSTPDEQLCNVLVSELDTFPDDFQLEPVLEGAAADPSAELPAELLAIAIAYRAHRSSYDQLGSFRPAIELTVHLVDLSIDDLIGPSTLTPTVVDSALAIDEALRAGACAS